MTNEERLDILEVLADAIQTARMELACRLTRGTSIALPIDAYRRLTEACKALDQLDTEVGQLVSDAQEATAANDNLTRMTPQSSPKKAPGSVSENQLTDWMKEGSR